MHPLPLPGDPGEALAPAGTWSLDLRSLVLHWSDDIALIHGLPGGASPGLSKALDFIETLDRAQLIAAVLQSIDASGVFEADVRITTARGARKLVRISGHVEWDGAAGPWPCMACWRTCRASRRRPSTARCGWPAR
jgi:hypothetical protein